MLVYPFLIVLLFPRAPEDARAISVELDEIVENSIDFEPDADRG